MTSKKIAALKEEVSSSTHDATQSVDAMNRLAFEIRNTDTQESISLCKKAQQLALEINYPEGNATALANEAFCYVQITDYELGLKKLFEALKIFEALKNEKGIAQVHYNLCLIYFRFSDFNSGLDSITKALSFYQKKNDTPEMARCFFQMSFLHHSLNDSDSATDYLTQSLALNRATKNKAGEAAAIMGLGQASLNRKEYKKSSDYLLKSMTMQEQIGDWRGYAASMNAYTILCFETGKYEEAKEISLKGIKLTSELGDKMGVARFMLDLGRIYLKQNNPEEAERVFLETLNIAEKINLRMALAPLHFSLSEIYESKKDYEKAFRHYQRFHAVKEEMTHIDASIKAKSAQFVNKIEHAQQEAEINRLKNVELKNACDELAGKNKDITDSLNYALRIQQAILPELEEIKKHLPESFVLFKPRDIVSGDFYWFHPIGKYIYVAAADCTGHGVPGAFMSMIGNSLLNEIVVEKQIHTPGLILDELKKGIIKALKQRKENSRNQDGMDIAFVRIDPDARRLEYAGAHNSLFILNKGEIREIPADKMPIGTFIHINKSFTNHSVKLKKSDALYLFSDGYAHQFGGPKGKKFSKKRVRELLCKIQEGKMEDQKNILNTSIEEWKKEAPQTDDILVIGIRI